jgi:hypothetical protein
VLAGQGALGTLRLAAQLLLGKKEREREGGGRRKR